MVTLTEKAQEALPEKTGKQGAGIRWLVMQSLKHQKWVLAVVKGNFEEYHVTDLMSENVELIVQCADYLNRGIVGSGLDGRQIELLEQLKNEYCL